MRVCVVAAALCVSSTAAAQLRDSIPADQIVDGGALHVAGTALAETSPQRADELAGELAVVATWTRAGVDRTQGFRGPRWTKRWGAALTLRAASGTGDRPLDLEERAEVALYAGSIGQAIRWQSQPRLTDRFWHRATEQLELGVFVDFGGLGLVKRDGDTDMSCEGFPIYAEVMWGIGEQPITTTQVDVAAVRVANERGDLRLGDERIVIRDNGAARALALDAALISARSIEVRQGSPWRLSGAIGISALTPFSTRRPLDGANSIIPLARIGIEHRGSTRLHATRSAIGRPLLDDSDFGVELASMHRWVETGIDAGGQLTAWWQRPLAAGLVAAGEAMLGVGRRQLVLVDGMATGDSGGAITLVRGEVRLAATLGAGFLLEMRAWAEHSERTELALAPRWHAGLSSGLAWHR